MTATQRQVAIITGASSGIGAGLVVAYREQGWAVVANARKMPPADDQDILAVDGDIADPATADRITSAALDQFGRIDTLINCAGIYISKRFTDYTAADFDLVTGVNVAGFWWLTQRVITEMVKARRGHIVNVSATVAVRANKAEPAALPAITKGGLAAVTRSLAIEYAEQGIRVNAVSPGVIKTPLHPAESYSPEALDGRLPPIGRAGEISDVVRAILYLESAPYVTGEILHIDGGQIAGH
jgi:NAD(P)-dependent dehydrogenase (short-subunit alcohol dehydrogenase family)